MEVLRREKMLCSGRTFREIDGSVRGGRRCCAVGGRSGRLMEVLRREKMLCSGRTFREIDGSVEEGEDAVQWEDVQGD